MIRKRSSYPTHVTPISDVECGLAARISDGSYIKLNGTLTYGSFIEYNCDRGFRMVGSKILHCDMDGKWSGPPPSCEGKIIL